MKRTVWRHIWSERSHVTTPHDYAALVKQLCSNVQIEFVAKSEINQQFAFLDAKWEGVMAVPQTRRVHCIQASGADQVKYLICQTRLINVSEFVEFAKPLSLLRPNQQLVKILR